MVTITFENGHLVDCKNLPPDFENGDVTRYLYWPNIDQVFFHGIHSWQLMGHRWEKIPFLQENNDEVLGQRIVIES